METLAIDDKISKLAHFQWPKKPTKIDGFKLTFSKVKSFCLKHTMMIFSFFRFCQKLFWKKKQNSVVGPVFKLIAKRSTKILFWLIFNFTGVWKVIVTVDRFKYDKTQELSMTPQLNGKMFSTEPYRYCFLQTQKSMLTTKVFKALLTEKFCMAYFGAWKSVWFWNLLRRTALHWWKISQSTIKSQSYLIFSDPKNQERLMVLN